jgi:adenylate cyclase
MDALTASFDVEPLLEGTEGDAREGRRRLLEELAADGVAPDELRAAVEEDRLVMIPVERVYSPPGERLAIDQVAERAGVSRSVLERHMRALGLRAPEPGEEVLTERDLEMATLLRQFLDVGLPEEGLLEVTRVIGLAMSQVARAVSQLTADTILREGDSERDVAMRLAEAARGLTPMASEIFDHVFRAHQLELLRSEVVSSTEVAIGRFSGAQEVTVCFADLVGFTSLGERLDPEEYGALTDRLAELVSDLVEPPVRLVKLIGDAAMLSSRETEPLLNAALGLQAAATDGEDLPQLRIGVARGPAVARAGDLYGRAVNLASRLTAIARPGSVLCDEATRKDAGDSFEFSFARSRRIKGIDGSVKLFRARPPEGDER